MRSCLSSTDTSATLARFALSRYVAYFWKTSSTLRRKKTIDSRRYGSPLPLFLR